MEKSTHIVNWMY